MSNEMQKTLSEIIDEVLLQFQDSNLMSNDVRKRIADEICNRYYTEMEITNDIMDDIDIFSYLVNDDFEGE